MDTNTLAEDLLNRSHPTVTFLLGPNGAGKSSCLKDLAIAMRHRKDVIAISNTVFDRFSGLHGLIRISVAKGPDLPAHTIKRAIVTLAGPDAPGYASISSILRYCGYVDSIGLRIVMKKRKESRLDPDELILAGIALEKYDELDQAATLSERLDKGRVSWVEFSDFRDSFRASFLSQYLSLLKWEKELKKLGLIASIDVFLRSELGDVVPIRRASSGQLTLLSTIIFLATSTTRNSVILVDEPENSLHPKWQREYVDTLLTGAGYAAPSVVIATHAPLVVLGALQLQGQSIEIFKVNGPDLIPVDVGQPSSSSESVEQILWEAFETITPASHYLSTSLTQALELLKERRMSLVDFERLVASFKEESFDERQLAFLEAVRDLAKKVHSF